MSNKYQSQYTGLEIDEEIKYVKDVARRKIEEFGDAISNKADEKTVVKYAEKNQPNGYLGLDKNGKVDPSLLYGGSDDFGQGYSPYIGEDGNWYVWDSDSGSFVDSGVCAVGYTPQKGVDYFDGYSPIKGGDYWTEEDKAEMIADVLAALPVAEEVAY